MDFTDLNKACPKDNFPLPKIDKLINSTIGFEFLNSLDANLRYHKILIHLKDKEKMSFIIERLTFYYRAIPFNLKNIEVMY